jgi:C_GCAxxG_C_C family probable redox protein
MNKDELKLLADEYYSNHNCAQAVVLTMAEYFDMKNDILEHVAAPFGGGLCATRVSVCGAVSGGVMFLGLYERDGAKSMAAGSELIKFVEERYGHRCCDMILDIDFNNEAQVKAQKDKKRETICAPLIRDICVWIAERCEK